MIKKLRKISEKSIDCNPYWEYKHDKYELPSGKTGDYWYVNSRGSTMVVPRLGDDQFLIVKQYRYLNSRSSLEFPGGGLDEGLSPSKNAQKELQEETGYVATEMKKIGEFNPYNGVTNEICSVFAASGLKHAQTNNEESEQIEVLSVSSKAINELIVKGEIWDAMTIASWHLYQNYLFR